MNARSLAMLAGLTLSLAATRAGAQCTDWISGLLGNGGANGANGYINAIYAWDPTGGSSPELVVAGGFTSIEGVAANHIAIRDNGTGHWKPLGGGVYFPVNALTVWNGYLVAAGSGNSDPGNTDGNIAYFDGSSWHTFYDGTSTGSVYALAVLNGELYAGGNFVIYPTVLDPAVNFAHWNAAVGLWESKGSNFNEFSGPIYSFAFDSGILLAGGSFVHDGDPNQKNIAAFDGANWGEFCPGGNSQSISSMCIFNGQVCAASSFSTPTGYSLTVGAWNGSAWVPFGGNYPNGMDNSISSIYPYGGHMFAAGYFTHVRGLPASHIAWFDGSAWQPIIPGIDGGADNAIYKIQPWGAELIAGGAFANVNVGSSLIPANNVAHWNGTAWSSYGGGSASSVLAMTNFNGRVVAGGDFHQSIDLGPSAEFIGGWNGSSLEAFGTGMDNPVFALASYGIRTHFNFTSELVAGGSFTHAGGTACNFIARWDQTFVAFPPPAWAPMGPGFSGPVAAIERFNNVTYAGGIFRTSGAVNLNCIGKWNTVTSAWDPLSTGMGPSIAPVYALKTYGSYLYVGGVFTTAGGLSTGILARWDGTSWSAPLGIFSGSAVYALEVHNGVLYIGGNFPGVPGNPNLIAWDGTNYAAVGVGGADGVVRSLHSTGGRLYVGGDFNTIGGLSAPHVAYWDGSWHRVSNGTDNSVTAITNHDNVIEVGGRFVNVNSTYGPILSPAWGRYDETGIPAFAQNPSSQTPNLGDNVTLTAVPDTGYAGLSLQWLHNGAPLSDGATGSGSTISGAHSEVLNVLGFTAPDVGNYRMVVSDACGNDTSATATLTGPAGVEGPGTHATVFDAISPNPSGGASQVAFTLARDARVEVRVRDVSGRLVRTIDAGALPAGAHHVVWDARGGDDGAVRPGMYFVGLEVDGRPLGVKRLAIIR